MSDNNDDQSGTNNGNGKEEMSAEKARHQYVAEMELAAFAELYFARLNEEQICKALKIHRSTYYRYLNKLADQQRELLDTRISDSTYAEIANLRNNMRFVEQEMKRIMLNQSSDDAAKIEAAHMLCKVSWASVKMHTQGSIRTVREMPGDFKKKLIKIEEKEQKETQNSSSSNSKDVTTAEGQEK